MKNKYIIVIFIIGVMTTITAALFKLLHWSGASILLFSAYFIKLIAVIFTIIKILTSRKLKDFLNS